MRQYSSIVICCVLATIALSTTSAQQQTMGQPLDFVQKQYVHGVPYEQARALGPAAVPALLQGLQNREISSAWPNIVQTLGFIGDQRALKPLISFLENSVGEVSSDAFRALLLVPRALGDLGRENQTIQGSVLEYLTAGARQNTWTKRVQWYFRAYRSEILWRQLSVASVHGLGHLATSAAEEALVGLSKDGPGNLKSDIAASLGMLRQLRKVGTAAFFERRAGNAPPPVGTPPPTTVIHDLTVSRHLNETFSDATADGRLAGATTLLKSNNKGCTDEVVCDAQMKRKNAVSQHGQADDGLDVIDNIDELSAVFGVAGNIKIVTSINWCAGASGDYLGCARNGSNNSILIASAADDVFAHEFGHNKGLGHTAKNACDKYIMHPSAASTNAVTLMECISFQKP